MFVSTEPSGVRDLAPTSEPSGLLAILHDWVVTVDHKRLGIMYVVTGLVFLVIGGVEAFVMRLQLAKPGLTLVSPDTFNRLFTVHGTTMVFLVGIPIVFGFGNYLVPLMIGARDLAFPRLNAFGFWILLFGGALLYFSFIGGDGLYGAEILKGAGFPAAEGFYATIAAPNLLENPEAKPWVERFAKKYGQQPENYSITAYDAALVILDAVKRVAESGKEVNRANVRDAIQASKTKTLQGEVSFDENGDITNREVSVFQIKKDEQHPLDSVLHQYKYLGVAPQSS